MGYDPNTGMLSVPSSVPLRSLHYNNDKSNPQDRTDDTTQVQEQKSNHNSATCTTPTPLHRACHSGALGCIQLLLNAHADILIPDLSFGDGCNAMHKAAKGGRPLAVILLLDYLKLSPLSSFRREVITSRDSNNRTPLQIAMDSAKKGVEEISSLRRWDVVAGGSNANFEECVRLLKMEEEEIDSISASSSSLNDFDGHEIGVDFGLERGIVGGEGDDDVDLPTRRRLEVSSKNISGKNKTLVCPRATSMPSPASFSFQLGPLSCVCDDEIDGTGLAAETQRCKTAAWEAAFQNALFQSTMAILAPTAQHDKRNNTWRQSNKVNKINEDELLPVHEIKTIESKNMDDEVAKSKVKSPLVGFIPQIEDKNKQPSGVNNHVNLNQLLVNSKDYQCDTKSYNLATYSTIIETDDTTKALGQPCSKCAKDSLTLFRDELGNLVCRTCLKQVRRRRY